MIESENVCQVFGNLHRTCTISHELPLRFFMKRHKFFQICHPNFLHYIHTIPLYIASITLYKSKIKNPNFLYFNVGSYLYTTTLLRSFDPKVDNFRYLNTSKKHCPFHPFQSIKNERNIIGHSGVMYKRL
jgi:hypothetical protein